MTSRAVRLTLTSLFVLATGVSAYLFWAGESRTRGALEALRSYEQLATSAARDLLELRAAQQAYVAAGQGGQFWGTKVEGLVGRLRDAFGRLGTASTSPTARAEAGDALSSLDDFGQMDGRVRGYARSGQTLLASDLIFDDGIQLTSAAVASIDRAVAAERQARGEELAGIRRRQVFALGSAGAAALLVVLLLVPQPRREEHALEFVALAPADANDGPDIGAALDEGWSRAAPAPATPPAPAVPAAAPAALALDLSDVASLCTDLARLVDTRSLPAALQRAASVLDASGIVLWIADTDGRELSPIVTHGYTPTVVTRLGTILRDAQNVTAAAFRTSLLQTVDTDAVSNGAIAAPLMTPGGCVGVMAAEVRHAGEKDQAKLAAATIVAAQLATLVGPPSARPQAKAEVAG